MSLIIVIILAVLLCVLAAIAPLAWYFLAPTNRWFTFVKEGTAKTSVKGDAFFKAIIQLEGYTFDENWNVVPADKWVKDGRTKYKVEEDGKEKEMDVTGDTLGAKRYYEPIHPFGGFRYYGFYPIKDIYTYRFKWTGVAEDGKIVSHPPEVMDFILLKDDVYWAMIEKCEDENLLPLDVELLLTIQIVNPYKALFRIQNWLETAINRIKPFVRGYITHDEYKILNDKKDELGKELMVQFKEVGLLAEFWDEYGVNIKKVEVRDINPPEDFREKTLAPYFAELDKEAVVVRADGESERIEKVFSRIEKFGDLGKLVRTLEAVEKSPLAASLTVQAVPGLQEALRGVFGRPSAEVSTQEFRRLRETVERMAKKMEEKK